MWDQTDWCKPELIVVLAQTWFQAWYFQVLQYSSWVQVFLAKLSSGGWDTFQRNMPWTLRQFASLSPRQFPAASGRPQGGWFEVHQIQTRWWGWVGCWGGLVAVRDDMRLLYANTLLGLLIWAGWHWMIRGWFHLWSNWIAPAFWAPKWIYNIGLGIFCACFGLCFDMFPRRLQIDTAASRAVSAKAPFWHVLSGKALPWHVWNSRVLHWHLWPLFRHVSKEASNWHGRFGGSVCQGSLLSCFQRQGSSLTRLQQQGSSLPLRCVQVRLAQQPSVPTSQSPALEPPKTLITKQLGRHEHGKPFS